MKFIKPALILILFTFLVAQTACNRPKDLQGTQVATAVASNTSTFVVETIIPTTPEATQTPRPTASLMPTFKLTSTPTLEPTFEIVQSKLDCVPGKLYTKCTDERLQIEFEYPIQWGEITTFFRKGFISGYAYDYQFETDESDYPIYLEAGGRSKDFSERRGGSVSDFSGFETNTPERGCLVSMAAYCREIRPSVLLEVYASRAEDLCQPGPGIGYPVVEVKVDLKDRPTINGFVFATKLLTEEADAKIDSILGYNQSSGYFTKCADPKIIKQVNAKLDAVIRALQTNSLDAETRVNYNQMLHLAQSIKFTN